MQTDVDEHDRPAGNLQPEYDEVQTTPTLNSQNSGKGYVPSFVYNVQGALFLLTCHGINRR